ncbi:MAG: glycoside hydrolase family 25 protein [Pseudomonadota bacterium]
MARAQGIDVSHHHRVTDWEKVAAQGFEIFGAKATNGGATDPAFVDHRAGARAHPFDLAVYFHFPTPKSSAIAQADHLIEAVSGGGGLRANERIALDVEWDEGNQWCPDIRFVDEFVREAVRLVGDRRMFVYTSARVWAQYLGGASWPAAVVTDLWAPRYGPSEPVLPVDRGNFPPWPRWAMWQDSESFDCPGVDGPCDHDVWRGDRDDLLAYIGRHA